MPTAFLTGATGLIGGETCRLLLEKGWRVIALVRSDAPIVGNEGQALTSKFLTRVVGDIGLPACGLDQHRQDRLAHEVDLVIHCAASTVFNEAEDRYQQINVAGTANVLSLGGTNPFLHVSTAYVCGTRNGVIAEASCSMNTDFANGYERSKAKAEALVERSRRPWLIARPSIVVGSAIDGRIRRFDSIYGAFKLLAEGRIKTIPVAAGASLNFVPVDHVALALTELARGHLSFTGQHVHLCSRPSMPVTEFIEAIAAFPGLKVPYLSAPEQFGTEHFRRTEQKLFDRLLKPYLPYFQRGPVFATGTLEQLTGLQSPLVDQTILHRLFSYALKARFLRADSTETPYNTFFANNVTKSGLPRNTMY
jgi:nucleoside-diphosphate-sugar epimerase